MKGKIYKKVIRHAILCRAENWPVKKFQERKLWVVEKRILGWMSGVKIMDISRHGIRL